MQLHELLRAGPLKKVLAGNFACENGRLPERRPRIPARSKLWQAGSIAAVAHQQIKIHITSHRGVAIGQKRNDGALHQKISTALGFEADVPESAILAGKIPGEYLFKRAGRAATRGAAYRENLSLLTPRPMRIEDLYARKRHVPLESRDVPAVCLEDELVLNCIHGAKHFGRRLMWPADNRCDCGAPPGNCLGVRAAGGKGRGCGADVARGPAVERIAAGRCGARRNGCKREYRGCGRGNWCGWSRAGCRPRATCHQLCHKEQRSG